MTRLTGNRPACCAPLVQMFLLPDGTVKACVRNLTSYGNVGTTSLLDLWHGAARRELVDRVGRDDFSGGCENCGQEVALEGRAGSYSEFFDARAGHLTDDPASAAWPRWIDFNISNACNLQCVQCNGDLSSSIRIHRERRPALVNPYGEQFFEDLRAFIPHLDGALFAGGEPFLANENYRVWDLIAELRPDLPCTVTTNATQWNDRVEDVLGRLRFSFVVSIDSVTPGSYEAIRPGAQLDEVLANVARYQAYTRERGTTLSINHCLMQQNVHEFPDFLLWAEQHSIPVNVSVVRSPPECSLTRMPPSELAEAFAGLRARDHELGEQLNLNLDIWRRELARIGTWVHLVTETAVGIGGLDRTVMMFRVAGDGPVHPADVMAEIRAEVGPDVPVTEIEVDIDDVIVAVSPTVREVFGDDGAAAMLGQHYGTIDGLTVRCFGERRRWEVLHQSTDRFTAVGVYGTTELRVTMFPVRDDRGSATGGRIFTALVSRPE